MLMVNNGIIYPSLNSISIMISFHTELVWTDSKRRIPNTLRVRNIGLRVVVNCLGHIHLSLGHGQKNLNNYQYSA